MVARVVAGAAGGASAAWPPGSARLSQPSFQKIRQPAWQPPWALPSQRTPSRCTVRSMRYMPLFLTWSQVLKARLETRSCLPANCSISGMNGSASSRPRSSRLARISLGERTSTSSPILRSSASASAGRAVRASSVCTLLVPFR